jgi:hypothetical protein
MNKLTDWFKKTTKVGEAIKEASSFSQLLLLAYKDAISRGVVEERERWQCAFQILSALSISIFTEEERDAFQQITSESRFWEKVDGNKVQAGKIALMIVMRKSNNASIGGLTNPEIAEAVTEGALEGLSIFEKKYPEIDLR